MNLKVYLKRKYDSIAAINTSVGKSLIIDSATTFYMHLEEACKEDVNLNQKYDILRNVFSRVIEQTILDCRIALVGLFSKVDYCIKEYHISGELEKRIHDTRKELFPGANHKKEITEEVLSEGFAHNLKITALLVYHLCGKEEIPESLKQHFPKTNRELSWGAFSEKCLRTSVKRWDDKYIWATEEENGTLLQICYDEENKYLTREGKGDWEYLNDVLWEGAVLNLVRIRMNENEDTCLPELIILEPDYLINITTIAGCFETYAESPFVNLIKKLQPAPNAVPIHLGNFSGQLLDNTIHDKNENFEDTFRQFVSQNPLNLITCPEFITGIKKFKEDANNQKRNIERLIGQDLPNLIGSYDKKSVVLEPSYFSSTLGIQGRFDFLYEQKGKEKDRVIIIEQKSGKSKFIRDARPEDPIQATEQHKVQALLYRALYQYELTQITGSKHKLGGLDITPMFLYSKYANGLTELPPIQELLLRAIKMRNLLAWSEYLYAKEGMGLLTTLTPDKLNRKNVTGRLWEEFIKPKLSALLSPIHNASTLERAYYLRFLRFIENELLHTKVGNKMKENSGFASIWNDTLENKKSAGNIYDNLIIDNCDEGTVANIKLRFLEPQSADTSNFRIGDIVILYCYKKGEVPNACADMVHRASIVDIRENIIELRLRNPQTDSKIFKNKPEGTLWAIEHDMFESMTSSLYSAIHSFLSAPKQRRDLVLSQRMPETDTTKQIRGDYGNFNELVTKAKQAKDLFLIIGPPGTGKTSFGLVNLLKEELLEEGSNVLLLSYTNRAVDEICSKLVEIKENNEIPDFDFIRIGSDLSCAPDYRKYLLSTKCEEAQSGNEVNKKIKVCRVFCGTTASLNANMSLFSLKHFNLAIVDESSQILEPHLIGLLSASKEGVTAIDKFVLIGDHKQLPAVVQQEEKESVVIEPELKEINLTDCRLSLFERLLKQFKKGHDYDERFVYMLTKQGRMHKDIAEFPNYAFYGNKLDIVPLDHQLLPNKRIESENGIINMLTTRRIVFIESESPKQSPSVKTNSVEAEMIAATVRQIYELTKEKFDVDKTVGVIVPYRNQISTVRNAIDRLGVPVLHKMTIDTVERYQGSQRDYIIYGFTIQQSYQLNFLTNNVFEEDNLVIDRKLNVAMTRARLNLVMIGNPLLLNENFTFYKLMEFVRSKGGYFKIPVEDYCKGSFQVPDVVDADLYDMSENVFGMSNTYHEAFKKNVITPIKEDPRTSYPEIILGNRMDANMSLINYGRIDFSNQLSLFSTTFNNTFTISPKDQVLLYCYYIMRMHYCSAKGLYHSYSEWLMSHARDVDGRVRMIDIGCGPATCGLTFYELFKNHIQLSYTGVDVSVEMKNMASRMLSDVCDNNIKTSFVTSFNELKDSYWASISEIPNLVIFNMSYFFSNVDSKFTENLANRIIEVMQNNPLNKYVFMIQHSEHDNGIGAFRVFRKRLSEYVTVIKSERSQFRYQLGGYPRVIPFCYDIWSSK